MSALGKLPVLLLAEINQQLGQGAIGIVKGRCENEIILKTLEQFDALCGADYGEGLVFVAEDGGLDQD